MKKYTKILSLFLAATMVFSLAACGGKKGDAKKSVSSESGKKDTEDAGKKASEDAGEKAPEDTGKNVEDKQPEAPAETKDIKLVVWSPQEDQAGDNWLGKMCDAFNAEHPEWNITFEYGVCSEGDAKQKVGQDPTAAADVYMYANDHVGDLVGAKAIARFGGKYLDEIKASNSQTMLDSVTYTDGVYGVPFTSNTWFMYYDKRVFSEAEIHSLDKMLEKGKVSFPLTNGWYLASFYVANGCTFYGGNNDEAAGIDFGGDKAVAVTKKLVELKKNPNFVVDADGAGIAGLDTGAVNVVFSGTWDYENVKAKLGEENVGVAQLPKVNIDGNDVQLKSFAGSKALAVNPNSAEPKAAVELALFLGSAKAQKEHFTMRTIIPSHIELLHDADIMANAVAAAQANTVANTSIMQPFVPAMGANYWGNAEAMGKAIDNGDVTLENAAEKTEAFNNVLNGR